jgi:hypothetical protein
MVTAQKKKKKKNKKKKKSTTEMQQLTINVCFILGTVALYTGELCTSWEKCFTSPTN